MKLLIPIGVLFAAILCLTACSFDNEDAGSNLIEARTFLVNTPPGWVLYEDNGIDTYVGRIAGPKDTIYFDQGYMSFGSLDNVTENNQTLSFQRLTINGVPAIIYKEKVEDDIGAVRLSIYLDQGDQQRLNHLYTFDPKHEKQIVKIFKSHRFR